MDEAGNGGWFYARFAGVCHVLNSTNAVAFDTPATDNIDHRSVVIVPEAFVAGLSLLRQVADRRRTGTLISCWGLSRNKELRTLAALRRGEDDASSTQSGSVPPTRGTATLASQDLT